MDDLYGDLPPASSGNEAIDQSTRFFQGQIKATENSKKAQNNCNAVKSSVAAHNQQPDQKTGENEASKLVAKTSASSKTKMIPSALMFKPRQTSTTSANNTTRSDVSRAKETNLSVPLSNKIGGGEVGETMGAKEKEPKEEAHFNSNASFDVRDSYDPHRPNDYLQYCDEREEKKRVKVLEEESRLQIERIERQRAERERQKKELADKQDYKKLIQMNQEGLTGINALDGGGRGRGRGLVNLPAWMTQQISETPSETSKEDPKDAFQSARQFEDADREAVAPILPSKRKFSLVSKPSKILLLANFVDAGEVDDGLASEMTSECEKFGKVARCEVHIVDRQRFSWIRASEEVRIFIEFERQDAAIKAMRDLQGRYFGGKQIQASYFEEARYKARLLDPEEQERVESE